MLEFDLIVIGSGSGLDVANAAASSDMKVAIIEKGPLGGTCLNRGCIPSKILIHSADVAMTVRRAAKYGIHVPTFSIDFEWIVQHANEIVDHDSAQIERALTTEVDNPRLFKGEAHFVGLKTLQVGDQTLHAERILIAAGGRPSIPDIAGLQDVPYLTSDEALRLQQLPKELLILGGGYIAAELGHFFGALGSQVTIIYRGTYLLRREDVDIAKAFTEIFSRRHTVLLNQNITQIRQVGDRIELTLVDHQTGQQNSVSGDTLLVATGRTPNTDRLNLPATGVETTAKGYIAVNQYLETNVKGIYALGDIVGRYLYKHNANHEAQYVYWNMILGRKVPVDYGVMPHAIFSEPQVASVGLTEQECQEREIDYALGLYRYADTGMGLARQEEDGFVKLIVDRSNARILGGHILGPEASTLVHEVAVAMKCGKGTLSNILNTIHVHPALSEVVQRAAHAVR